MAWFKVDDGLHASRKLLSIPRTVRLPALGLWTMAGSWSAHEELDGFIPSFMLKEWGGTPRLVRALVESGLWVEIKDGAQFHNWAEYQPTRAELEEGRERERVRKAEYRKRTRDGGVPAGHPAGHEVGHQVVSEDPDPTRPDPTPYTSTSNEVERAPSPFCPKHPNGTDGPCRACGNARLAYTVAATAEKNKPTLTPTRAPECATHPGWPLPCDKCARIAAEEAA